MNEKIKLRWCAYTDHCSPTVRNAKINLQNNTHNITLTTHPTLSFYLRETYRICNFLANCCDYTRKQYKAPISLSPEVYETSSKTGSGKRILYLLTGPRVGPGYTVLEGERAPPLGAKQRLNFSSCLLWPNSRPSQQLLSSCWNGQMGSIRPSYEQNHASDLGMWTALWSVESYDWLNEA